MPSHKPCEVASLGSLTHEGTQPLDLCVCTGLSHQIQGPRFEEAESLHIHETPSTPPATPFIARLLTKKPPKRPLPSPGCALSLGNSPCHLWQRALHIPGSSPGHQDLSICHGIAQTSAASTQASRLSSAARTVSLRLTFRPSSPCSVVAETRSASGTCTAHSTAVVSASGGWVVPCPARWASASRNSASKRSAFEHTSSQGLLGNRAFSSCLWRFGARESVQMGLEEDSCSEDGHHDPPYAMLNPLPLPSGPAALAVSPT